MRKLLLLSACLMACAALALADDKDEKKEDKSKSEAKVTPTELAVNRKVEGKSMIGSFSDQTRVSFVLSYPKKHLLGVDKTSKMTSLKDDKGNELFDDKQPFSGGFNTYAQVAEDGSAMQVSGSSYLKAPGKGATKVTLKGDLVVLCGADEKTVESKKIEFKEKSKGKAGDFEVAVTRDKEGFGAEGAAFTITTKLRGIRSVVVKDADGKAVEIQSRGWSGFGGETRTYTYALTKPLKEGTVHVTYFAKEEKLTVPIDLTVGLDLGR